MGVGGGCLVHFRVFSSIPGLYPLETSSTLSVWQPKCLQTFSKVPQGVKPPICQPMISRLLGRRHDVVLRCCKFQHYYFGFLYYFSFIYSTNSSFYLYYYLSFFLILLVHYFSPFSQALNLFHYSLYDSSIVWLFLPYLHSWYHRFFVLSFFLFFVLTAPQCGSPLKYFCTTKAWGHLQRVTGKDSLLQATRL